MVNQYSKIDNVAIQDRLWKELSNIFDYLLTYCIELHYFQNYICELRFES